MRENGIHTSIRLMTDWESLWKEGTTPWDKGAPAPPLQEYLALEDNVLSAASRILVPGCGAGHDVRELAARTAAKVVGLDVSAEAVARARDFPAVGGEQYECGDFFARGLAGFDAIWEHTCFCAINPSARSDYAAAAAHAVRGGGWFVGVFYLEPWSADEIPEPPPFGAEREEIIACLSPGFSLRWEKVPDLAYPGREGREWLAVFERSHGERGVAEGGSAR